MRKIKFRAWDKEHHNMQVIFDNTTQTEWFLPNLNNQYEIMQYTGLCDKNGKEIYEGDIVHVEVLLVENVEPYDAVIEWKNYGWCMKRLIQTSTFRLKELDDFGVNIMVIGNIFEDSGAVEIQTPTK